MVKLALPLIALATAASAAAVPGPTTSGTTFSFSQWVEDIIANPDTALTPDEAIEAAQAADVVGSAGGLAKRAWCHDGQRANGRDAAGCIDYLARLGNLGYDCVVGPGLTEKTMCIIGTATFTGLKSYLSPASDLRANCIELAQAGGFIFDRCWRADDTVRGSEYIASNSRMILAITGSLSGF